MFAQSKSSRTGDSMVCVSCAGYISGNDEGV